MLWEIDLWPREGMPNRDAESVVADVQALGLANGDLCVTAARGFLIQSDQLNREQVERLAAELFVDTVTEEYRLADAGDKGLKAPPPSSALRGKQPRLFQVLFKPGVMDPVSQSAEAAVRDFGWHVEGVRTLRKYWLAGACDEEVVAIGKEVLANDAIELLIDGPLPFDRLPAGSANDFELRTVSIRGLDDAGLMKLSREGQLYLQLAEMQTIQRHFAALQRDPTDIELETIAQTWSEHCSHKTLAGRIAYQDEHGERLFENMLKETIFEATQELRRKWGDDDWCVSVFKDNSGVVRFDEQFNVTFKVETHNHPSAIEPYGGANTGLGGVIRDTIGTGLGAKPVCNTDVFCFAPPETPHGELPPGVLHPKLVMRKVVEGVRDYGNRMGIPTVNGAVFFDPRYLGNPLVYCGSVGLIPRDKSFKQPMPNDLIVAVGGRTGRDGIHGATFSSAELTQESESISGGAVQIGNAIEEKKLLDVMLAARDRNLFSAITDCGAGGFSSAVGEMGEEIGAVVHLDRAPMKYAGLTYTEIWISEAQERVVLSVPEEKWPELELLCASEGVEATVIGRFEPTGRLSLKYRGETVGELAMEFLHKGRPPVVRQAKFLRPATGELRAKNDLAVVRRSEDASGGRDFSEVLLRILGSPNVASKEWIIRQYDHEVQGGSVIKPLVGATCDGPSDAAVVRPVLGSRRGIVIANGMNPRYGEFDPYHMAASAIDEAIRNCVAVGADPRQIALLDNFCWGDCERAETLGSLVRAALACHDLAIALETPFISGKDSLNNEFRYVDDAGNRQVIAIPPSLLISALGQVEDVSRCVTMDLKQAGNSLYLVGETKDELGGSHYALVNDLEEGAVPTVDATRGKITFAAMHRAISAGLIAACHDLSEGGLAAAAAEMAFAGGLGVDIQLNEASDLPIEALLFSESNSRFLCEVRPENASRFEAALVEVPLARVGNVRACNQFNVQADGGEVIRTSLERLKESWQRRTV